MVYLACTHCEDLAIFYILTSSRSLSPDLILMNIVWMVMELLPLTSCSHTWFSKFYWPSEYRFCLSWSRRFLFDKIKFDFIIYGVGRIKKMKQRTVEEDEYFLGDSSEPRHCIRYFYGIIALNTYLNCIRQVLLSPFIGGKMRSQRLNCLWSPRV